MRTVRYPEPIYRPAVSATLPAAAGGGEVIGQTKGDDYSDKLTKYIPAEVIAFYLPAYNYINGSSKLAECVVLIVAIVGTLIYLAARVDKASKPRCYFYPLAIISFICWAIGTSSVASDLLGLPPMWAKLILSAAIFLIPGIDQILTNRLVGN